MYRATLESTGAQEQSRECFSVHLRMLQDPHAIEIEAIILLSVVAPVNFEYFKSF